MAIFSIFGKKEPPPATTAEKTSSRPKREEPGRSRALTPGSAPTSADRTLKTQRDVNRAASTAKKIDAIEYEMSSQFTPSTAARNNSLQGPTSAGASALAVKPTHSTAAQLPASYDATLPGIGMTTEFLLGAENRKLEVASSETAQVIEEAAILFANDQTEMAEQLLQSVIQEDTSNNGPRTAWWMLFDLYQITGREVLFETVSIDYASRYETSPPAWVPVVAAAETLAAPAHAGATPAVAFSGKLDGHIIKLLERAQKLGESSTALRLEFSRVTEVDPIGCGLLLRILHKLHKSEHDLILVGAPELAAKIRSILEVGRRDETEAPWLLLMEILRLLNRENEFEETSIDYCVTFEVSPPAFVAPKNKVTTESEESGNAGDANSDCFMMPAIIEGRTDQLSAAIMQYSARNNPVILDCSRLKRVDFTAAGQMLSMLAPLTGSKTIEFRNVNYLVTALFDVMGLKDIARIVPRKH